MTSAHNNAVRVRGALTNVASLTVAHTKSTHALHGARPSDWRIRRVWCLTGNQQAVTHSCGQYFLGNEQYAMEYPPYKK